MTSPDTPPNLSGLEGYIREWGLPTIRERIAKRAASTYEELKAFHDALLPRLDEILTFLNRFPADGIPGSYKPLLYTVLSVVQIDSAVNKFKAPLLDEAVDPRRFVIKENFYDNAPPQKET